MGLKHVQAKRAVAAFVMFDNVDSPAIAGVPRVEMALDDQGLWWFRHTTKERVWVSNPGPYAQRGWNLVNTFEPWYCPELQPDPAYMPGSRARPIKRGTYRMLPSVIRQPNIETITHGTY